MLVLSRKINESVVIAGEITVKIVRIEGDQVRLGIQAPTRVPIHRQEVYDEIQRNNRQALDSVRPRLPRLRTSAERSADLPAEPACEAQHSPSGPLVESTGITPSATL